MATYRNPPAAISYCKAKGACSPGELYSCAIDIMPHGAPATWAKNARRLAESSSGLCGAKTKRRVKRVKKRAKSKQTRKRRDPGCDMTWTNPHRHKFIRRDPSCD